jgi:rubrerythrin
VVLDIAVVNEFRLGGSKHISNFENGLQKDETCFIFKKRLSVPVWHCLVCGYCTAETSNAVFKMRVPLVEVEGLR